MSAKLPLSAACRLSCLLGCINPHLAWMAVDDDVAILADSAGLLGVGQRGSGIGGLKSLCVEGRGEGIGDERAHIPTRRFAHRDSTQSNSA